MSSIELSEQEIRGTRAAVLEAVTDQIFQSEPDVLARSEVLLFELSARAATAASESMMPRVLPADAVSLEAVGRSLAHVAASVEGWELPIRIGLSRDQLDELGARIAACRSDSQ